MNVAHAYAPFLMSLYEKYHDYLVKWCYRFVNYKRELMPLAEDFVQEAFLKAVKHPDKVAHHAQPLAWLIVVCKNVILHYFRHRKVEKKREKKEYDLNTASPIESKAERIEQWEEAYEAKELLGEILHLLTEEETIVYKQYFVHKTPVAQIAKTLGKSKSAVKDAIHRIRRKARSLRNKDYIFLFFFCSNGTLLLLTALTIVKGV